MNEDPVRRGLARPHPARPIPGEVDALLDAEAYKQHLAEQRVSYLSLTDADREAMLEAIGVASIDELFADLPAGVRFGRELDLAPALSEQELNAHLEELAAENVDTSARSSRSSARASTTTTCPRSSTPCSSAASS